MRNVDEKFNEWKTRATDAEILAGLKALEADENARINAFYKDLEFGTAGLRGELGAGKTAFVKGLAAALGITDEVTSPTFTLMNVYRGALTLYHFDVYRLHSGEEAYAAGLTEFFGEAGSVSCIEWWENVADAIVGDTIKITINYLENEMREINVER